MVLLLVVDASSTTTPMPYPDITLHLLTFDNQQIHRHTSGYVTRELGNTTLELQVLRTEMYSFNIGAKFDKVLYSSGTRLKWKIKLVLVTVIVVCYVLRYKAAIDFFSITVFKVEEMMSCLVNQRTSIYVLKCTTCQAEYKGETMSIRNRIQTHCSNIRMKQQFCRATDHFVSGDTQHSDVRNRFT